MRSLFPLLELLAGSSTHLDTARLLPGLSRTPQDVVRGRGGVKEGARGPGPLSTKFKELKCINLPIQSIYSAGNCMLTYMIFILIINILIIYNQLLIFE